jgi:hypothetical protein
MTQTYECISQCMPSAAVGAYAIYMTGACDAESADWQGPIAQADQPVVHQRARARMAPSSGADDDRE